MHLALRGYGDNTVVSTSGSDVRRVMGTNSEQVSEPIPVRQVVAPVRIPVRRIVHRARPLPPVEVLRNGTSTERIPIDRNGLAGPMGGSAQTGSASNGPSAYVAGLGDDNEGTGGGYGVAGLSSASGMAGAGVGITAGGY